ncbi:MAG TPA: MFS transporter [Candidatus Saccharimonadales bacterium]|nr:MFS transporter [Candidatus Saccharimonadales bacterium]
MKEKEKRYSLVRYLAGALPARLGDEMSDQAILLVALAATGSIRAGSTVLAGLTVSTAIGGPLLGTFLDRSNNPGRILTSALILYAIGLAIIAFSLGRIPLWAVVLCALIAGFFMPAISGGWSSRLKTFIADEQMAHASAIDATTFNIAGLIGPGIAGLIAASFGAYWAVAALIALLALALPMAWRLPRHTARQHMTSFAQDVASGFNIILKNKALLRITLVSVISYMGIGMLWVIYPLVGKELLGKAGYGGLLASVLSVSALVATMAYTKWRTKYSPDTMAFVTTIVLALAMGILLLAHHVWIAVVAMLISGLADGPQLAAIFTVRHRGAPERLRSQVFTTGASLKITAAAVGAEIAGVIASRSLSMTITVAGLAQVLATLVFITCTVLEKRPNITK